MSRKYFKRGENQVFLSVENFPLNFFYKPLEFVESSAESTNISTN